MDSKEQGELQKPDIMEGLDEDTRSYLIHQIMNGQISPDSLRFNGEKFAVMFRGNLHETEASGLVAEDRHYRPWSSTTRRLELEQEHLETVCNWMEERSIRHFALHWIEIDNFLADASAIVISVDDERVITIP